MMRHIGKRCCEAAVLLCCLTVFAAYGKSGAKVVPLTGIGMKAVGFWENRYVVTDMINSEWDIAKTAVDEAIAQGRYDALLAAEEEARRKEVLLANEERFYELAGGMELNQEEMAAYYQILCRDNVFQDGIMRLTGLAIYDIDQNGQKDMAAMLEDTTRNDLSGVYGTGCIYFYMNGEAPYCFRDEEFPFHFGFALSCADIDHDGNKELVFESHGTGNGGSGDWYGRILKYEDHTMREMELPSEYADRTEIDVQVTQEMKKDTYSAYCSYFDETIVFHAPNCFEPYGGGGGNCRGFYDLRCVEYQGGYAVEASEYLYGEGGHAHGVGIAKFIIVWDEDGSSRVDRWWIEPW